MTDLVRMMCGVNPQTPGWTVHGGYLGKSFQLLNHQHGARLASQEESAQHALYRSEGFGYTATTNAQTFSPIPNLSRAWLVRPQPNRGRVWISFHKLLPYILASLPSSDTRSNVVAKQCLIIVTALPLAETALKGVYPLDAPLMFAPFHTPLLSSSLSGINIP